jgi:hypothetical protein
VARTYSAILALLAMVVVLLRAIKHGAGFDDTIIQGLTWMALMAVVGMVMGYIAEQTVDESVQSQFEAKLAAYSEAQAAIETKPTEA